MESLRIPPEVQAARDAEARKLIANEDPNTGGYASDQPFSGNARQLALAMNEYRNDPRKMAILNDEQFSYGSNDSEFSYSDAPVDSKAQAEDSQFSYSQPDQTQPQDSQFSYSSPDNVKEPNMLEAIGQGALSTVGQAVNLGTGIVGGLINTPFSESGGTEVGDALIGWGINAKKKLNEAILTPEEQAKETLPQKIMGSLPAVAAMLPLGVAAPAAMGAMQGFNAATEALDEGASLKESRRLLGVQAASGYITGRLPIFGKNVKEAAVIGATTSPVIGAVTDFASEYVLKDRPEIAAKYQWNNPETRAIDFITGGAFGAGFKYIHGNAQRDTIKKIVEDINKDPAVAEKVYREINDTTDMLMARRKLFQPNDNPMTQGMSHSEAWQAMVKDPRAMGGRVSDILDLMAQDTAFPRGDLHKLAVGLSRLSKDFGLDKVYTDTNPMKGSDGTYRFFQDKIDIKKGLSPDRLAETYLHETIHSLTSRLEMMYRNHRQRDGSVDPNLSESQKRVWELMDRFNHLKEQSRRKFLIDFGQKYETYLDQSAADGLAKLLKKRPDNSDTDRAFLALHETHSDLGEFMARLWTDNYTKEWTQRNSVDVHIGSPEIPPIPSLFDSLRTTGDSIYRHATDHLANLLTEKKDVPEITKVDGVEISDAYHRRMEKTTSDINERIARIGTTGELTKYLFRRMSNLIGNVKSMKEFITRMRSWDTSEAWQAYVTTYGQQLYNNPMLTHWAKQNPIDENLGPNESRTHQSDLTVSEAIDTFIKGPLEGTNRKNLVQADDLNVSGKSVVPQEQMSVLKGTTPLGRLMKWFFDKSHEYRATGSAIYADIASHLDKVESLKRKDQDHFYNTILAMSQDSRWVKLAKNEGRLWATEEELRARNMNDAQIEAYKSLSTGLDKAWDLINQIRIRNKQEPLEQIPGYFPHVWSGPYRVIVKAFKVNTFNGKLTEERFTVAVKTFKFRQQAEAYARELKSGKHDAAFKATGIEKVRPDTDPKTLKDYRVMKHEDLTQGLLPSIQEHMEAYQNVLKLSDETLSVMQKLEQNTMQGMTKHALEREDSNVSGWVGEFGLKKGNTIFGTESKDNRQIKDVYRNYMKSVTKWYTNSLFVDEVAMPLLAQNTKLFNERKLYGELFANTPNFNRYISEFTLNFTGNNANKLKFIDDFLQNTSIAIGIDPLAYRRFSRMIRNSLTAIKLRANPANYVANMFQPMNVVSLLEMHNSFRVMDGEKGGSAMKAFAKVFSPKYRPDADAARAVQWAKDNHYIDPQLQHQLHEEHQTIYGKAFSAVTFESLNSNIEMNGRIKSFLVAYEFFRDMYPDQPVKAREAANKIMEMTMVNYNRESRPLMFQNFGIVGEQLSPFAVFRQAYIGNTWNMMKLMWQAPTLSARFKPIFVSQLTFLATAGALGMIGIGEINSIIDGLNAVNPEWELPRIEDLLFEGKVPDAVSFGALSAATKTIPGLEEGVYLGSSMNAVGLDDLTNVPTVQFMKAILSVGGSGLKSLGASAGLVNPPTWNDLYGPARQLLPGVIQPWLDKSLLPNPYVAPKSTNLDQGYVERTDEGYNSMYVTGRKSLEETKRSNIERVIAVNRQLDNKTSKQLIDLAVDKAEGLWTNIDQKDIYQKLIRMGMTEEQIAQKIVEGMQNRRLTQRQKEAKKTGLSEEQYRYLRYKMDNE